MAFPVPTVTTNTVTNGDVVALPIGTPVYASGNGVVKKAIATSFATAQALGVVDQQSPIAISGTGTIGGIGEFLTATTAQWDAVCGTSGGLAYGVAYYLSAITAGKLTSIAPAVIGNYVTPVLVGVSSTVAIIAVGVPVAVGATSAVSGLGTASSITKYTGAATLGNSQITDDGTHITLPDLSLKETDLGALGAGPLDLDLSAYSTSVFKFTCALAGTLIRSVKRKDTGAGQTLILRNQSSNVNPGEYACIIMQDDPGAVYSSFHLEGRQPWFVLPPLGSLPWYMDPATNKWFSLWPMGFATGKKPIRITATIANTTINSLNPPDDSSGLLGQYADWWVLVGGASTVLNGILAPLPAGSTYARRILLSNYSNTLVLKHNNGSGVSKFLCPGSVDFSLRTFASVWVVYDEGNAAWLVEAV